jgi:aminoglycoside phosphotransferase
VRERGRAKERDVVNVAADYLAREWPRLQPRWPGAPQRLSPTRLSLERLSLERLSWVAVTPRFRTSAHVVLLALAPGSREPVLVAKVSRLPGRSDALDREATSLRAVQAARAGGFDSVPRLVATDVVAGTHLLVETGVPGRPLDARMVRRRPDAWADALLAWTLELHDATAEPAGSARRAYDRLIAAPLHELERRLPPSSGLHGLIARTRELTAPLRDLELPLVLEHGDLSAPNLLASARGRLGVVDWELAESASLPAQDLLFALAYLAVARAGATSTGECVAAFRAAFFGGDAWARSYVARHAAAARLPREAVTPLFVACWSRYVAKRATRLLDPADAWLAADTVAWLEQDRFVAFWDHAVRHADRLRLLR